MFDVEDVLVMSSYTEQYRHVLVMRLRLQFPGAR